MYCYIFVYVPNIGITMNELTMLLFLYPFLKMLGLYLYTLIIIHKFSNMLRILNKLTLYKELQTFVTNNVFLDKKVKSQQQQNRK